MKRIMVLVMSMVLFGAAVSSAYEVVDVKNGGGIKGKIKAAEKIADPTIKIVVKAKPDPKETELEKTTCGDSQQARMYIISPANEVKNVLVIVEDVQKGLAAPKTDLLIDNTKCYFEPIVGIAYKGANFKIRNSDPLLHNTNLGILLTETTRRSVYNLALPNKGQVITKPVRTTGLIAVKCDAHDWMRAYAYASENPYVAITDASGNFEIKDLLPGKYKVRIWHEGLKEVTKTVDVSSGKMSELDATLSKK
jgi:carboxypeptidase family protein